MLSSSFAVKVEPDDESSLLTAPPLFVTLSDAVYDMVPPASLSSDAPAGPDEHDAPPVATGLEFFGNDRYSSATIRFSSATTLVVCLKGILGGPRPDPRASVALVMRTNDPSGLDEDVLEELDEDPFVAKVRGLIREKASAHRVVKANVTPEAYKRFNRMYRDPTCNFRRRDKVWTLACDVMDGTADDVPCKTREWVANTVAGDLDAFFERHRTVYSTDIALRNVGWVRIPHIIEDEEATAVAFHIVFYLIDHESLQFLSKDDGVAQVQRARMRAAIERIRAAPYSRKRRY